MSEHNEFNDIISFMIDLDKIQQLHIEAWSWTYLTPFAASALLEGKGRLFQTSTVLDLKFIQFPSFDILCTFASQFPALRQLSLDNVTWDEDGTPPSPPQFLSQLQTIIIRSCLSKVILSWLANGPVAPVRTLTLPELLADEVSSVLQFLSTIASSLEHLELGFLAHNPDDAPLISAAIGELDLGLHPHLRTLRVHQLTLYQFPSTPPTPTSAIPLPEVSPSVWLVPFLQPISSSIFSELAFNIWLGEEKQLDSIDWNGLVKVLEGFTDCTLHFSVRGVDEDMADAVRGCGTSSNTESSLWGISHLFLLINVLTMLGASGMVITKRHTEYAVAGLLSVVIIQGFGYGLIFDLNFFLRNLSVIGGLFMVFSDSMVTRKKLFAGLPSISETDRKKYFLLAGRVLLIFLFLGFILQGKWSIARVFVSIFGLAACVMVAVGFKAKWSAAFLVLTLSIFNVFANNWWSVGSSHPQRDFLKYDFFQTLSIVGGLILLVNMGPGGLSVDEKKKTY
ncbi:Surfeit locus protein 4 [Mycena kentingensis (nom. inval.)]|nr:Surfeit locus protein 4 [Mycena kentingensis (nom. inval.)]